jgi:hypothetical protein
MKTRNRAILVATLSIAAASCSRDKDKREAEPPPVESYAVTVTAVDAVNKDSGESLDVSGLPAEGGVLTVQ